MPRSTSSSRADLWPRVFEDIARKAGVAKGTIYLYFKDKEELFHELIRSALVPLVGQMDPSLAAAKKADGRCWKCSCISSPRMS